MSGWILLSSRPRSSAQRLDGLMPTYHVLTVASCSVFGEGELCEPELCILLSILEIVLVTMVLIDRASEELYNGG